MDVDFAYWVVRGTLDMDVAAMQALDESVQIARWNS